MNMSIDRSFTSRRHRALQQERERASYLDFLSDHVWWRIRYLVGQLRQIGLSDAQIVESMRVVIDDVGEKIR
jgi:glucose-6-phosphate-specific signal transduction histidine kinase